MNEPSESEIALEIKGYKQWMTENEPFDRLAKLFQRLSPEDQNELIRKVEEVSNWALARTVMP